MKKPEPKEQPDSVVDIKIHWPGLTEAAVKSLRRKISAIAKSRTFNLKIKGPCKTSN